jgi:hypothetical protein
MTEIERPDRAEAHRRAETIRDGMRSYALAMEAIGVAYESRDWVTLGHKDWDTYCEKEFSERRLKLTRDQREQAVLAFRGAGMSTRAIAAALGVDDRTVRRDLSGAAHAAPEEITGTDGKTYPAHQTATEGGSTQPVDGTREVPAVGVTSGVDVAPAVPEDSPAGRDPISPEAQSVATADQPEISHPDSRPGEATEPGASLAASVADATPSAAPTAGEGSAVGDDSPAADHLPPLDVIMRDGLAALELLCHRDPYAVAGINDEALFDRLLHARDDLTEWVLDVQYARIERSIDRQSTEDTPQT